MDNQIPTYRYMVVFKYGDRKSVRHADVYTNMKDLNTYIDSLTPAGRASISDIRQIKPVQIYDVEEYTRYKLRTVE